MENIFHRVSIRKYEDRPVGKDKIMQILRAAMQSPSATNQQPWRFYVITNKDKLKALSEVTPYTKMCAAAPVAIVSTYVTDCRVPQMAEIDSAIAMENIWLETDALGLGGVWLGIAPLADRMKDVEDIIGNPEGEKAFAIFPFGYPAEERAQADRWDESKIHFID